MPFTCLLRRGAAAAYLAAKCLPRTKYFVVHSSAQCFCIVTTWMNDETTRMHAAVVVHTAVVAV